MAIGWPAAAEEPVKSGPQPGQPVPGAFEPLNITGEHAGERYCLTCAAGLQPEVMIFARTLSEPLLKLLKRLETAIAKHSKQGLGSFCVFLSEAEGLDQQLRDAAEKHGLAQVVLAIDAPEGPDGYDLAKEADVTVVLYEQHIVRANHALRAGGLDDAAIGRVMADLAKILPAE
ncbi:MAG: hypothetical protein HZB16_15310 [Armatimonadetes bacterium]|nr:hypothetical protein [Armatimonadota bacterium]